MSLSEIEIEHNCYCAENGLFCPYLDKASGLCIATTCKHAQDLLQQVEYEKQAKANEELKNGYLDIENYMIERALQQLEQYGAAYIDLNISDDDLHNIY